MKNKRNPTLITTKKKIFNVFFGNSELPEGEVIITPISKIYQKIKNIYPLVEESEGWWPRVKIEINSNLVTLLKVPLSSHIKDCLEALDPKSIKKIILLGFCGGLNSQLKIGKIVIPKTAIFQKFKSKTLFKLKENLNIITIPQIILKSQVLQKLYRNKINLLDMETFFLYEWGDKNNILTISILIISDQPIFYPFFLCNKKEFKKIDEAILKIGYNLPYYLSLN